MNKTKEDMVAEMLEAEKLTMATDRELTGFSEGCRKMYDARQKEIDELHNLINRISGKLMDGEPDEALQLVDSYLMNDAAAKKVMEVK